MKPANKSTLLVKGTTVAVLSRQADDYLSLTDIAKHKEPDRADQVIQNWMRNRNTVEFLGIWESLNNPDFKPLEFEGFRNRAGLNSFVLTPRQWIESTAAVGLISKSGRYGGTFAHKDIAFEFASWISVEFKLYLIREFQRLKVDESNRLKLDWNLQRTLAKINYRIHTDAIKDTLIPPSITKAQALKERGSLAHDISLRFSVSDFQLSAFTHRPRRAHQSRKPQLRSHPPGTATARTPRHPQRHRHHPNADPPQRQQREAPQIVFLFPTSDLRPLASPPHFFSPAASHCSNSRVFQPSSRHALHRHIPRFSRPRRGETRSAIANNGTKERTKLQASAVHPHRRSCIAAP